MSFGGTAHFYIDITLLRNPILNLLTNCMSPKAPQMLSLKDECTFRFSNVQIIGLGNSSPNGLTGIILHLIADLFARVTALPEVLLPNNFDG